MITAWELILNPTHKQNKWEYPGSYKVNYRHLLKTNSIKLKNTQKLHWIGAELAYQKQQKGFLKKF